MLTIKSLGTDAKLVERGIKAVTLLGGRGGEVTKVTPSDPSDTTKPFELDLEYSQTGFLDWSNKRTKVGIPMLSMGLPDASPDQVDPIHLGSPLDRGGETLDEIKRMPGCSLGGNGL